jgi:hypothetical protein
MPFTFKDSTVDTAKKFYDGPAKVDLKVVRAQFRNIGTMFHVRDRQDRIEGATSVKQKSPGQRFERFIGRNKGKLTVAGLVAVFANLLFRAFSS